MNKCVERIFNGLIKENPTFVLMLGMCPTLAVTTSAINGLGMGLTTTVVLIASNFIISALRNIIPDRVRIPAYIVIVASLVTVVQMVLQAFIPSLNDALGVFIPLIVVNCIILGRAESYASKNDAVSSAADGIGMGLGFAMALTIIGACRELIGAGSVFGFSIIPEQFHIAIFTLAPGAFFVLSALTALQNKFKAPSATNGSVEQSKLACGGDCMNCSGSSCMSNHEILDTRRRQAEEEALAAKKAALAKKEAALKAETDKIKKEGE